MSAPSTPAPTTSAGWNGWLALPIVLHAVLFIGVYQSGFSRDEVHALLPPGPYKLVEPYRQALRRYGPLGVLRTYYFGEGDERLYLEYARLTLSGEFDRTHVDKVQRRSPRGFSAEPGDTLPARPYPYRDVVLEYPPLALLAMLPPALISTDYALYRRLFAGFMLLLQLANLALAFRLLRPPIPAADGGESERAAQRWLLWASLGFCVLLGRVVATRMDALVASWTLLCLAAGARTLVAGPRPRLGAAALAGVCAAAGIMTKLVPGLSLCALLTIWLQSRRPERWRLAAVSCGSCGLGLVLINAPLWAFAGRRYLETFSFHTQRGIQIESLYAGLLAIARGFGLPVQVSEAFGSTNLDSAATPALQLLSPWLLVTAALLIARRRWPAEPRALVMLTTALLGAYILTSRVFSPQYLIWLAPPLLAAGARDRPGGGLRKLSGLLLLTSLLSQLLYPSGYPVLKAFHPLAIGLLNLRNLGLCALTLWLVHSASQRRTALR